MAGNITQAYLTGFKKVDPVPGFDDVLSRDGMMVAKIPGENALIEAGLAGKAMAELGANRRQKEQLEALALQNDWTHRANRQGNALRMAGALFGSLMPGEQVAGVEIGDPLALLDRLGGFNQNQRTRRANNSIRSNTYAAGLLRGLS
jgi:hypothetical protein